MRSYRAGGLAARSIGVVMEGFKEFLGKTLDAAIEEACTYYNATREKLEIEIIQDAKTGIFGIVGARKAKVRARRAALREVVESALGRSSRPVSADADATGGKQSGEPSATPAEEPARETRPEKSAAREGGSRRGKGRTEERSPRDGDAREGRRSEERGPKAGRKGQSMPAPVTPPQQTEDAATGAAAENEVQPDNAEKTPRAERPRHGERSGGRAAQRESRRPPVDDDLDEADESLPRRALEELDQARLQELSRDCVSRLIRPMLSQPVEEPEVDIVDGRVRVAVDCGEDSGLLIGREGQTLAALQYLASRIVSRGMDAAVRVQLDAGRYRQRQEEKLRDIALALAAKVRQTGRSYSTRPLSSYHRRIIHLCLQEMDDILTRSTGDGPLKRVVILRRRPEKSERQPQGERDNRRRSPRPEGEAESRNPTPTVPDMTTEMPAETTACDAPMTEVREAAEQTAGQDVRQTAGAPAAAATDGERSRDEA